MEFRWTCVVGVLLGKIALNQLGPKNLLENEAIDERKTLPSKKILMNFIKVVLLDTPGSLQSKFDTFDTSIVHDFQDSR